MDHFNGGGLSFRSDKYRSSPTEAEMRALLIAQGAHTTGSLAATRALGQAGWTVGVASSKRKGFAVSSRWSKFWHSVPSPVENLDAFVAATNRAITDKSYEVVFGAGDENDRE